MSKTNATLLLLSGCSLPLSQLSSVLNGAKALTECDICDVDGLNSIQEGSYKVVYAFVSNVLDIQQLTLLRQALFPGGIVLFQNPTEINKLRRNCLLSSFMVLETNENGILKVQKPEWNVGARSNISVATKWTVSPDDEILDDDDFLTEEDMKPPPLLEGGKKPVKKACENCTCGRAEGKEPVKLTQDMLDNPVTACGSCGLGDAYRCATCPYRGLPSFEAGKKIELPPEFLVSDI